MYYINRIRELFNRGKNNQNPKYIEFTPIVPSHLSTNAICKRFEYLLIGHFIFLVSNDAAYSILRQFEESDSKTGRTFFDMFEFDNDSHLVLVNKSVDSNIQELYENLISEANSDGLRCILLNNHSNYISKENV